MSFEEELGRRSQDISERIAEYLPRGESLQKTVIEASVYSVLNGGKRIRPLLLEEAYLLCGGETDHSLTDPFMAAIEMIHCSSLVHDDLPCMDNDVLRRGKPSTWAKFGEDMGTLAGDALMIYAFETALKSSADAEKSVKAVRILSEKTGIYGMIGGQTADVELSGQDLSQEELSWIYSLKTGALIEASLMMGAVLAGASEETIRSLGEAGSLIGLAFQIEDDILGATSTAEELGKTVGIDEKLHKTTWYSLYGEEKSLRDAEDCTARALAILDSLGERPFLRELTKWLCRRKS